MLVVSAPADRAGVVEGVDMGEGGVDEVGIDSGKVEERNA